MKTKNAIIGWAYLSSLVLLLLVIANILALHDIKQEYINPTVIDSLQKDSSQSITYWANCKLEWGFVQISLILQFIIAIIIFIGLGKATKKLNI